MVGRHGGMGTFDVISAFRERHHKQHTTWAHSASITLLHVLVAMVIRVETSCHVETIIVIVNIITRSTTSTTIIIILQQQQQQQHIQHEQKDGLVLV